MSNAKRKIAAFIDEHELLFKFGMGCIAGFVAGVIVKVTITWHMGKMVKTYIVRSKENPDEFFKVIIF